MLSLNKLIGAAPGRDYYLICVVAKRMVRTTINTLAARGLEERRNFKELLTESVGRVHFS